MSPKLDLWAESRRETHVRSIEYKVIAFCMDSLALTDGCVKVIPRHKILDEVEVSRWTRDDSWIQELVPCAKTHIALRTGRLKKMSVAYVTFVPDSQSAAHEVSSRDNVTVTSH